MVRWSERCCRQENSSLADLFFNKKKKFFCSSKGGGGGKKLLLPFTQNQVYPSSRKKTKRFLLPCLDLIWGRKSQIPNRKQAVAAFGEVKIQSAMLFSAQHAHSRILQRFFFCKMSGEPGGKRKGHPDKISTSCLHFLCCCCCCCCRDLKWIHISDSLAVLVPPRKCRSIFMTILPSPKGALAVTIGVCFLEHALPHYNNFLPYHCPLKNLNTTTFLLLSYQA